MRYCIFCGVPIPQDALYCQICGKKQPEDTVSEIEETAPAATGIAGWLASPKNLIIAGVSGFIIVMIIATAVMMALLDH